jgi:hypothetical protein
MDKTKTVNVGIGFATGRRNFKKILQTNVYNWQDSGLTERESVSLNLFVAYDLKYSNTRPTDYTNVGKNILNLMDGSYFFGSTAIKEETAYLVGNGVIDAKEAKLFFAGGYAGKRNTLLYAAVKNNMDYLIFLDDDEYPMAVTNTRSLAIWGGQHVLLTHLQHIKHADITNGHHCGYISPIPYIEFNEKLTEDDFRLFIKAISNDIINWDKMRATMQNGGVTYADTAVLTSNEAEEVAEVNRTKFISGANLCVNLTDPSRTSPFYNPPGARGEDTFLSTCLSDRKVLRVPCYTFHDGFSTYRNLMNGILPIKLQHITADSEAIVNRFYHACIGWIRYKPLLLYITQNERYDEKIEEMRRHLTASLPSICAYFGRDSFMNIMKELEQYNKNVKRHHKQFLETKRIWGKISSFLSERHPDEI